MRKAILLYITLDMCFSCRRLLPSIYQLSIFQPLFGISSQAFALTPIKLLVFINFSLFDKCLPSSHKLKLSIRLIISFPRNIFFYSIFSTYFHYLKHLNGPYLLRTVRNNEICISYCIQCGPFSRNNQEVGHKICILRSAHTLIYSLICAH